MPLNSKTPMQNIIDESKLNEIKNWINKITKNNLNDKVIILNYTGFLPKTNQYLKLTDSPDHKINHYEIHNDDVYHTNFHEPINYYPMPLETVYELLAPKYLQEMQCVSPSIESYEYDLFFTTNEAPLIQDLLYVKSTKFNNRAEYYTEESIYYFLKELIKSIQSNEIIMKG